MLLLLLSLSSLLVDPPRMIMGDVVSWFESDVSSFDCDDVAACATTFCAPPFDLCLLLLLEAAPPPRAIEATNLAADVGSFFDLLLPFCCNGRLSNCCLLVSRCR